MAAKLTSNVGTHAYRRRDTRTKRDKRHVTEMEQSATAKEAHRYRRFQTSKQSQKSTQGSQSYRPCRALLKRSWCHHKVIFVLVSSCSAPYVSCFVVHPMMKPSERVNDRYPRPAFDVCPSRLSFPFLFGDNPNMVPCRQHIQSERLRTFRLAGHPVRRGDDDDTTAVPALIPIPRGFGASEVRIQGGTICNEGDMLLFAPCCGQQQCNDTHRCTGRICSRAKALKSLTLRTVQWGTCAKEPHGNTSPPARLSRQTSTV